MNVCFDQVGWCRCGVPAGKRFRCCYFRTC